MDHKCDDVGDALPQSATAAMQRQVSDEVAERELNEVASMAARTRLAHVARLHIWLPMLVSVTLILFSVGVIVYRSVYFDSNQWHVVLTAVAGVLAAGLVLVHTCCRMRDFNSDSVSTKLTARVVEDVKEHIKRRAMIVQLDSRRAQDAQTGDGAGASPPNGLTVTELPMAPISQWLSENSAFVSEMVRRMVPLTSTDVFTGSAELDEYWKRRRAVGAECDPRRT